MSRRFGFTIAVAVFVLLTAATAGAGKYNRVLDIGDKAPDWNNLIGVDDEKHSLSDYADAKAIVLLFTCNHCPVAQACDGRIVGLQAKYKDKGVQFVAVSISSLEEDSLPNMKEHSLSRGYNFPYLQDPTQQIGHDYGAKITPEFYVLDKNRKIAFMGLMDDNPLNAFLVKKHYLQDAIDAVLAGETPERQETNTRGGGCGIQYERR